MYPNLKNKIAVPITKWIEIITSIQFWLILKMSINFKENGGKKSFFLQIQSINILHPNVEKMIVVPITNKLAIIMSVLVWLISQMNINCKENGGKQSFSCKSKASICVFHHGEHDCSLHNQKNGDYSGDPSLSQFTDEH